MGISLYVFIYQIVSVDSRHSNPTARGSGYVETKADEVLALCFIEKTDN